MSTRIQLMNGLVVSFLLLSLWACAPYFHDFKTTDLPIQVRDPGTQEVDVDNALKAVTERVKKTLPDAYFQGVVFSGKCQDLPLLQGKLIFVFLQLRTWLLKQQAVRAVATVDTAQQTLSIDFSDESDFYPATEHYSFSGDRAFKAILSEAFSHIAELKLTHCDVTLTQLENGSWDVRCGPLENFIQDCHFEIADGNIRDILK